MCSASRETCSCWWAQPTLPTSPCIPPVQGSLQILCYCVCISTRAGLEVQQEPIFFKRGPKRGATGPELWPRNRLKCTSGPRRPVSTAGITFGHSNQTKLPRPGKTWLCAFKCAGWDPGGPEFTSVLNPSQAFQTYANRHTSWSLTDPSP